MDQIRAIMKVIWQQRFWVLSCLGIIIAAICWKLAASKLDAESAANQKAIEVQFNNMKLITEKAFHGNPDVNASDRKEALIIRSEVVKLWQSLYDRQRELVLKWPESLGDEFLQNVEGRKFGEAIAPNSQLIAMQQVYREFAVDRFPALVEIVQAKKMSEGELGGMSFESGRDGGGRGDSGGGRGDSGDAGAIPLVDPVTGLPLEEENYIVQWHDQGLLRQRLDFKQRPTSLQIWVTQEDLWVYETLLHCIANANEQHEATRPDNAAIRWIMNLEVGRTAALASRVRGQLLLPAGAAAGEGGGSNDSGEGRGDSDSALPEGADLDSTLLMKRYIGEDGAPIADATGASGGECRRLPVRMVLYMQVTAIPTLLVECANAPLPVEVKRIRINGDKSGMGLTANFGAAPGGGGGGATDGRGGGDSGGGGGGLGAGAYRGDGGMPSSMPQDGSASGLAQVEIQGVVYIYNPPDPATLAVPGGDETVASAETSSAAL